jgi:uncharacterized protein (TIGR04141 family)
MNRRIVKLTMYMLRPDHAENGWGLRDVVGEFTEAPTRDLDNLQLTLLVRQSAPHSPRWVRDLAGIIDGKFTMPLLNSHSAALLLVRYGEYRFILCFGTGRFAIDRGAIQPGFGLRVAVNSVAASRVVSADTRELGGRSKSRRIVLPKASPLHELDLEPTRELLRQMEGKPAIEFANAIAGGESLKLNLRGFSLSGLEAKLDQIIGFYESEAYKKDYDFIDYFVRVDDKATVERLEAHVNEMLAEQSDDLDFAAPDITEPLEVVYYRLKYRRRRSDDLDELAHEQVYEAMRTWGVENPLKNVRVEAYDADGELVTESIRLLDYVITEFSLDGKRYALSAGQWYIVDEGFVDQVQHRINAIPDVTDQLLLDTWKTATVKGEGPYNENLAAARSWRLLDKKNLQIGGSYQKVEICDLLTGKKQLLCVKRMTQSSTLSHLFMQGLVSAELLASNAPGYRDRVLADLAALDPGATFGESYEWTIVYAIATSKPGPLSDSLYFFSKVCLDRTIRQLSAIGVKVAIARIQIEP